MGKDHNGQTNDSTPEVYRVRRSEVVGMLTIPVLVALFGAFWTYHRDTTQSIDRVAERLRAEQEREIDRLEKRVEDMDRKWEQRIVWIERALKK